MLTFDIDFYISCSVKHRTGKRFDTPDWASNNITGKSGQ